MKKRILPVLIGISALAISGCSILVPGNVTSYTFTCYDLDSFALIYKANTAGDRISMVVSNFDLLPSPGVIYTLDSGTISAKDYDENAGLNVGTYGQGIGFYICVEATFYDESYVSRFRMASIILPSLQGSSDNSAVDDIDHDSFSAFNDPLEFVSIEVSDFVWEHFGLFDIDREEAIGFKVMGPDDSAVLVAFYAGDDTDMEAYADEIDSYIEALSRDYAVMDNGDVRRVTIGEEAIS